MAAAAITPTSVQKTYKPSTNVYGSAGMRLVEYVVKLTKVTQNDWIVAATYLLGSTAGDIVNVVGYTVDSSSNAVQETATYTSSGDKVTMTSATVGTTYLFITVAL